MIRKTCISCLCLIAMLLTPATNAGDEDMSPNAYHIFDPETGYMITVESVPEGQQASASNNNSTSGLSNDQSKSLAEPQRWMLLLTVIIVAGGFIAWKRNKQQTTM